MRMRPSSPWAVAMLAAAVAALGLVGSDALWLVPLGRLVAHGHVPHSVTFARAPTSGWHDVPAGAQVVFWSLYRALGGIRGLVVAQSVAAAIGFGALARGLAREGLSGAALPVSVVVLAGSIPAVAITGVSLFSLALFPVLLGLLESESRAPSHRLWVVVPLLALWGNLHGGVLTGLGLLACYVVFARPRALLVLAASVAALFANPQLWHTPDYYTAVFRTVVARQGSGLWTPLGTGPFDLALVAAAAVLVLVIVAGRGHIRLWEGIALLGLAAGTAHVARTGTFFLFVAAYPAARALRLQPQRRSVIVSLAVVGAAVSVVLLGKGPADPGSRPLARLAGRDRRPVLADPVLGQQVVLAGGRVWVDNPVDAFRRSDQQLYVDWLAGKASGAPAVRRAASVLVERTSHAGRLAARDSRLVLVASDEHAALYRVKVTRAAGS